MYKKSNAPIKKPPNKAINYVACYVDDLTARQMQAEKERTGSTYSAIVRVALIEYFKNKGVN